MSGGRPVRSEYMEWAKNHQRARFTLALSGMLPISFADLGISLDDLALSPPGGYGWRPLAEAIAAERGLDPDRIVTTAGTSGANHLAMGALIDRLFEEMKP